MPRAVWTALGLGLGALALYFAFWPVPVDPVAWTPPPAPGYGGPFARNDRLAAMERLSLGADHGPEAVALDAAGRIYTSTREGRILRLRPDGSGAETYADTNGAPLGLHFDASPTRCAACSGSLPTAASPSWPRKPTAHRSRTPTTSMWPATAASTSPTPPPSSARGRAAAPTSRACSRSSS